MRDLDDMRPDRRRQRAQMFSAQVMRIVDRYVCDHGEENHDNHKHLHRELFKLFYDDGFDTVTDLDRANAGLPLRDDKGWTADELRVIEMARVEQMLRPLKAIIPAK